MPVFVKSYFRKGKAVKNYTRATESHRRFNKVIKKGHHGQRAARLINRIENWKVSKTPAARLASLNKRLKVAKSYIL